MTILFNGCFHILAAWLFVAWRNIVARSLNRLRSSAWLRNTLSKYLRIQNRVSWKLDFNQIELAEFSISSRVRIPDILNFTLWNDRHVTFESWNEVVWADKSSVITISEQILFFRVIFSFFFCCLFCLSVRSDTTCFNIYWSESLSFSRHTIETKQHFRLFQAEFNAIALSYHESYQNLSWSET